MSQKKPELLCPAGNYEKFETALIYGADAVYCAGDMFGMRAAADNFSVQELCLAAKEAHKRGKKLYITVNTMPREADYPQLQEYLTSLREVSADALIIADLGVMSYARRILPDIPIHISTQTSVVSSAACREYAALGAERIVLARELSLDEVKRIREALPHEIELECFIHGSMCVSWSGRCLLSEHFTGRDANQGKCTQPCRWNYNIYEIREEKRPDSPLGITETDNGTFIMSSRDMCTIEHMPELIEAGIDCFKIEGRMKSAYYTAVTANAYRMAIDSYCTDPDGYVCNPAWLSELESVSHREYCTGYWFGDPMQNAEICSHDGYLREKVYVGQAQADCPAGMPAKFILRNKICRGETAHLVSPGTIGREFCAAELYDEGMNPIESAPHPKMIFHTVLPYDVKYGDIIRL